MYDHFFVDFKVVPDVLFPSKTRNPPFEEKWYLRSQRRISFLQILSDKNGIVSGDVQRVILCCLLVLFSSHSL